MSTDSPSQLIDRFGRTVDYIRISVTDRCDFRCVYCMGDEMTFLPHSQVLTLEEIEQIATAFIALGVKKIRLTGGEPLVRKDVIKLIRALGQKEVELAITTNGYMKKLNDENRVKYLDRIEQLRKQRIKRIKGEKKLAKDLNKDENSLIKFFKSFTATQDITGQLLK